METTVLNGKERNTGIDFLRILARFFVVMLHCLGQGGVLGNTVVDSPQYKVSWLLEICAYGAVDIFALISGYVSYTGKEKKTRYANYFSLWLQTVFYGILVTAVFYLADPARVQRRNLLMALLPVTRNAYWYFTAYTGLFVLMPFLNMAILHGGESLLRKTACGIFIAFSVFSLARDAFLLNSGYSFIWITLLYVLGAIIKKCDIGKNIKPYQAGIGILIFCIFTWLYKLYGFEIRSFSKGIFVSYTSPTILAVAILYVIGFSKIRFSKGMKKVVGFAAPGAFAIYLLNTQSLFFQHILKDLFLPVAHQSSVKIVLCVIGFSLLFVAGAVLIDRARILLFDLCGIKKLAGRFENFLNRLITKVSGLI